MPIAEPVVLDLRSYSLRHIGPKAVVYPTTPGASFTVLNRSDLVARPIPAANIPNSVDFAQGQWNGRIGDVSDANLIFPNKEASDGVAWRYRFDPTSKLQWIEIWLDKYLESVQCITKVTPDRNQVLVECFDGFQMCKSAYERDWIVVQAPRDTIERGTQLWVPVVADSFPAGSLNAQWSTVTGGGGTVTVGPLGGVQFTTPALGLSEIETSAITLGAATGAWRSIASVQYGSFISTAAFTLEIDDSPGISSYNLSLFDGYATFGDINGQLAQIQIAPEVSYGLLLESDGEWVWAFVNGQLVGCARRLLGPANKLQTRLYLTGGATGTATATITGALTEALQPYLMRRGASTDLGDFVLPGSAATYPTGGLHARYYNDLDLQSDANRLQKILGPLRSQAYQGSSGPGEYVNQQDPQINGQSNPVPGAANSGWSVKWFGAIYLKLSGGNYTLQIQLPTTGTSAVRAWVGDLRWGAQLIDQWAWNAANSTYTATISATTLQGTLPYGGGTVARDGWYPIRVEFAVDSTVATAPYMSFTPPVSYTDPGGTAFAGGTGYRVPASSLTPLGCDDNRYQGTSHYDLVQKTAISFGYQFSVEPKQLESGQFPGILAPRIREGTDYDVIIAPDDNPRVEGMINYSAATDGTDQASSLMGNGAGFQNGTTGQLQGYVFDPPTLSNALFNMQGWQDAADASFLATLDQILNSELGLRLTPWVLLAGDPIARQRIAYTWPLTNATAAFRWRPGDGVRVQARDINVYDTAPRQLLLVTRNIHPDGALSTQVGWAARPKSPLYALRKALSAALRPQRSYQKQLVSLSGPFIGSGGVAVNPSSLSGISEVALLPNDTLVKAYVRITENSASVPLHVYVNGADQTSNLGGPWSTFPVPISLQPVAMVGSTNSLYVQLYNNGGVASNLSFQLFVDVLR